ncbi:MAG: hotdog domain-containing protein [Pseudomonadota bacterium]|nr:hotdog domain-containing protein [Pseudomonadota bacterium]
METLKHPDNLVLKQFVMPDELNYNGTLFGGQLLSWIDQAGAVVAISRSSSKVALLKMNEVLFKKPIMPSDSVTIYGKVTSVGRTSMEVTMEIWRTNIFDDNEEILAATASGTYVAIDENLKPQRVDRK